MGNLPRAMQLRLQDLKETEVQDGSISCLPAMESPDAECVRTAQSTDNLDTSGEPATRSVGTTANLKGKMSKRLSVVKGHFPKLADCAHFHYENVDFGSIEGKSWMVRRSYEEFRTLDAHLHQCIYDRRYSQLSPLPALSEIGARLEVLSPLLTEYLSRLSMIVDNKLNCGPVLTWMEIDNHGNRFLLKEEASLNVPAIAAAHVIKRYTAQASDEISIEVGDILSVIDMPPKEDTSWWRGKHGFQMETPAARSQELWPHPPPLRQDCMGTMTEDERMVKVHDVIQQLPPPHYRTLEYLMRHLSQLATHSTRTNMHIKNLAIVWAPNLLRSKEIEAVGLSGSDPFKEVRIQSVVVEFLLSNVEVLFSDSFTSVGRFNAGTPGRSTPHTHCQATHVFAYRHSLSRPKSFVSAKLLSLEEAQARTQAPQLLKGAPLSFQGRFHTVLDLPANRGKRAMKGRKSAGGSWKTFFAIGKPAGSGRRKPMRISSLFQPATSHAGCRVDSVTLRSAKSEESLSSQHSGAAPAAAEAPIHSRSYDSLLPEESRAPEEEEPDEEGDDEEEDDEEGVYMLPDFSQDPTSSWMAEDVIDFSPTFLEDGPIGLGSVAASGRESPPAATPPPYRCISHQGAAHSRSQSQRSITEDPDSVLNQSEAAARRSLILAAAVPSTQVFCQHKSSGTSPSAHSGEASSSPSHGQPGATSSSSSSHLPQERRSFTRKVVNALSPKAPKSPPLDISDPIAISVPAKVLEMIGGRAGELQPGAPGAGPSHPPQMISMLLRSCDFQLTESCQQEIRSKLGPEIKVKGQSVILPTGHGLPSQQPPPPPPKNPARLMALALAESANKALREGATPPYRPPQSQESRVHRSLSADADEALSSPLEANQLYSTVRPLAAWMPEAENTTTDLQEVEQQQERRSQDQDTGTLSSQTSASESGASNSEVSAGSSSGEMDPSPGSVYKNQQQQQQPPAPPKEQPKKTGPLPEEQPLSTEAQSQRKPPTYSRQFSAPPSQNKAPAQPQLLHSKSECSPLAQVRAFQPPRPKVPPKPLELAPFRVPLSRADNYMRRSLDAARIRRIITHSQGPPVAPLSRAYSERLSSTSDMSRYHMSRPPSHPAPASVSAQPPQPSHFRPAPASEDQSKMENFYYEIVLYQQHGLHPRHVAMMGRAPQLWSSETTRAWSAAHPFSYSFSHHHHHQDSSPLHQSLRQMSSSVRLPSGSAAGVPLSVHQRSLHRSQRSPSADLTTSQLHPYFENGKVCYRHVDAPRAEDQRPLVQLQPQLSATRCSPPPAALWQPPKQQDNPEPIYVNFPFCSPPAAGSAKSWITTDLDGDTQQSSDPLALPPEPPPEDKCESSHADSEPENPKGPLSGDYDSQAQRDGAQDSPSPEATPAEGHFRSRSDPQSTTTEPNQNLTGKEIASLLIEKLAEDEAEGPCAITSSSASSSPPPENPPNPYPSQQQPTYNVYTPGPSRSHFEGEMAGSQCPDPLRRSASSGGHYRQAFDVMPSGDQVLKFYRMQDFTPVPQGNNPNPYPARHHYQDPLYPSCAPQEPHHHYTSQTPTDVPHSSTAGMFSHLTLGAPRMYSAQAMGYQACPCWPHTPVHHAETWFWTLRSDNLGFEIREVLPGREAFLGPIGLSIPRGKHAATAEQAARGHNDSVIVRVLAFEVRLPEGRGVGHPVHWAVGTTAAHLGWKGKGMDHSGPEPSLETQNRKYTLDGDILIIWLIAEKGDAEEGKAREDGDPGGGEDVIFPGDSGQGVESVTVHRDPHCHGEQGQTQNLRKEEDHELWARATD
ncbi:rho GTPase-activating protein 33-like [Scleropages formosus]|uniref:Rho GTPase-activating protein 33-like n=1 Tax=Scleropages formosus TaxID=113540 RepID=A0A0P7WS39_SCLFO|nr:rho GTPase-activating protein 33-like [Scleropages formosus]